MGWNRTLLATVGSMAALGAVVAGCSAGSGKVQPDEFRIVTKAPLVIPPEYNVRPPRPGEPRPQELEPEQAARIALLGEQYAARASDGEQAIVALTGGLTAPYSIREQIDLESGGIARKSRGFADRLLFWSDGDTYVDTEVNPDLEAERLERLRTAEAATGEGATVQIRRRSGWKLPGL